MARIGTVGYLNARPLSDKIDIDRHTLVLAHPAEVARMLRAGEVDVALVPVAAALADGDFRGVPGVCIGADGPVHSVLLVAETEPEQWTRVVLDGVSRTSRVLARLLLKHGPLAERVRDDLEIVDVDPGTSIDATSGTTAGLVIGDAARQLPERLTVRLDLAEQWREWTGLPFVFAVWAGHPDLDPAVVAHLAQAGRAGVAAIADGYAGEDLRYLTENLRYTLDDRALMGLRRFAALAHRHGLLPTEHLELYPPGKRVLERPSVDALLATAVDGERLDRDEALRVWRGARLADLGTAADLRRAASHPGPDVPWILEARHPEDADPSTLQAAVDAGASRARLLGALDPERIQAVATAWPELTLRGDAAASQLAALSAAGLGAVESDDLAVLAAAIDAGLEAVATVAIGDAVDDEAWVDRLLALRELHDRTAGLAAVKVWAVFGDGPAASDPNTAQDHLRATAFVRLVLDDVPSLRGAPDTEGLGMAQATLRLGVDHYGVVPLVGEADKWAGYVATVEHRDPRGRVPAHAGVRAAAGAVPHARRGSQRGGLAVVVHRVRAAWTTAGLRDDVAVEVDDRGVIVALRPGRSDDPPPLDGLLVPGLVNAHVHLELSDRRGQVPGGEGLVPWVGALVGLGRPDDAQRAAAAAAGAREAVGFGTTAVSDISNGGDTAPALREAGLAGIVHHEVLGFGRERQEAVLAAASAGAVRSGRVVTRPSPHAVYSTPPAAIRAASVPRGGVPASIHLAEDAGEAELLADGTGSFAELLERIGVDWRWWSPPGKSPAAYLDALGVLGPSLLCVHGVHLDAADRALLAARGAPLCLCPRSNLHIGGRLPDVPALAQAGVTLVLGTDSLASCPDLDLLGEVAVLREAFPSVSPEVWLHALTAGGADALGLPGLGRLAVGTAPGLLLLEGIERTAQIAERPTRRWL